MSKASNPYPEKYLLAGVMGWPVMHSRSPKLHNFWMKQHGLEGVYVPLPVAPDRLEAALRALPALGFAGCSLTIPLKELALGFVDRVEPRARRIGAVNCIVVAADGTLEGYNDDSFGYIASIREAAPAWRADTGPIVVLGAGGASRAILLGLIESGAKEIRLVNRTPARAGALAEELGPPIQAYPWKARAELLEGAAMLINTTSLGLTGQPPLDIALDALPRDALVSDIVYAPLETPLLRTARAKGNLGVDGLGMLLHQARPAFERWFGIAPAVTRELRALIEATL